MAASTRWIVLAALVVGLGAAAALGGSAEGKSKAATATRPNVVVLETDDQTVESMRVMPNVKTLIADQGVTFDNSFVSYSLCCPSRSTFLTGQYAHNHGVWGNTAPNGGYYKLDSTNTLPVWLQRAGYQTILLGKYLNQYGTKNPREIPPGWGQWYGTPDPSTYRYLNYTINENGNLVQFGNAAADYKTDVESRLAVDLISRQATDPRPFFMMRPVLIYAFAAAVVGGLESPIGAVVGGLVIGVVLNLISTYDTHLHVDLDRVRLPIALALILIVLLARPTGLFGKQVVRRV